MSKKPIIGGIILAAIVGVVFVGAQINPDNPENEEVGSIRMASPEWHERQTVGFFSQSRRRNLQAWICSDG